MRVDFGDGGPVEHFAIGDIRHTDGRPWEYCTRSILKAEALQRLERVSGLTLFGAFEHEFQFRGRPSPIGDAYFAGGLSRRTALRRKPDRGDARRWRRRRTPS